MDMSFLSHLDENGLKKYIEFVLWHYRVVDGFWFLYVAEQFDQPIAERINERVWSRVPQLAVADLLKRFDIKEKGLKGFVKMLRYFPWAILVGYQIEEKDDEVLIRVPDCPMQTARLRRGLEEYNCREMHRGEFEALANGVDPRIKVECLFAPPDHPPELFCTWRFTMEDRSYPPSAKDHDGR